MSISISMSITQARRGGCAVPRAGGGPRMQSERRACSATERVRGPPPARRAAHPPRRATAGHGLLPLATLPGLPGWVPRVLAHGRHREEPRSMLGDREHVPVRVLEPGDARAARRGPDPELVLIHPREALAAHAPLAEVPGLRGDVGHLPAE